MTVLRSEVEPQMDADKRRCFWIFIRVHLRPSAVKSLRTIEEELHQRRFRPLRHEFFRRGGKLRAQLREQRAAFLFRKRKRFGGGINETARGLKSVTEQSLPERHG